MAEKPPEEEGMSSAISTVLHTLRETVENRVELLLVELKESRIQQIEAAVLMGVALFCGVMTLVMLTFVVVVLFWDTHRMLVLLLLTGVYGVGTVAAISQLRSLLKNWHPFSATLDEIKKDAECFKKPN